ncbi:hypothetical protein LY76DRAFT_598648 [Colletotrichum caudatum]|nr:hypothetical protein LY76DRAFT_598648 [Colletotrichum caudatum]
MLRAETTIHTHKVIAHAPHPFQRLGRQGNPTLGTNRVFSDYDHFDYVQNPCLVSRRIVLTLGVSSAASLSAPLSDRVRHHCYLQRPSSARADHPTPALQATSSRIQFAGTLHILFLAVICLAWRYHRLRGAAT